MHIDTYRRRFVGTALMALAAAPLSSLMAKAGMSTPPTTGKTKMDTSFGPLKQINAGVLSVGYVDA